MQSINSFFNNAQQQISSLYGFQDALLYQPNEPDTARTIV
ncbi:unnamed protein product, partial [Rotaria sp. Silwood2]